MIFFSNKCGQLGNRLFAFAHLIAFSAEHGVTLVNLSFDEYAKYFKSTDRDVLCRYPAAIGLRSNTLRSYLFFFNKIVLKILRKIGWIRSSVHEIVVADLPEYRFDGETYFNLSAGSFVAIAQKPIVLLYGRFFRDYENFEKHKSLIRNFFEPCSHYRSAVQRHVLSARQDVDLLIGLHIRRGDYAEFADGKYFYSPEEYFDLMRGLQLTRPMEKIRFLICSNEPVADTTFEGISFLTGTGNLIEDMYALAECDFIMGPPSTFTLWASFFGNKPLYQIRDKRKSVTLESFVIPPPEVLYNFSFN